MQDMLTMPDMQKEVRHMLCIAKHAAARGTFRATLEILYHAEHSAPCQTCHSIRDS